MLATLTCAAPAAQRPSTLSPQVEVSRELLGSRPHIYALVLSAGDFVRVTIAQRGIDIAAALTGPDGREAVAVDAADDPFRPEVLSAIVDGSGRYTIAVRRAPVTVPRGRYAIRVDAIRPATDDDRTEVEAERAYARGRALVAARNPSNWQDALKELEAGLAKFRDVHDHGGEFKALLEIANLQQNLGQPQALASAQEAQRLAGELDDRATTAAAAYIVGRAEERAGDLTAALHAYETSTAISHEIGNSKLEATSLNTEGIIHGRRGDSEGAVTRFEKGLRLARAANGRLVTTFLRNNLALAYTDLGEREKALSMYEQTLADSRPANDRSSQAGLLQNIANTENALGEPRRALESAREALKIAREIGHREFEASALNLIGISEYGLGDFQTALDFHGQSLAIRREMGSRSGEAAALEGIGRASRRLGDTDRAASALVEALEIRRQIHEGPLEADTLQSLAAVERDRGNLAAALEDVRAATDLEERLRAQITSADFRATFIAAEHSKYELFIDLLQQENGLEPGAGHEAEALQVSERARARVLLDSVLEAHVDVRDGAVLPPPVLTAAEIQKTVVDDRTVLLEFALGEERSWLWAIASTGTTTIELPPRRTIEAAARSLYEGFTARQRRPHERFDVYQQRVDVADARIARDSAAVSRMLFGGIAEPLNGEWRGKRLAIVATGALEYLPFAALPAPKAAGRGRTEAGRTAGPELLIATHEIVGAPSASVVAALRTQTANRAKAPRQVAIVADPVFDPGDPRVKPTMSTIANRPPEGRRSTVLPARTGLTRLPFSGQEAKGIASLVDPAHVAKLTGFNANRTAVLNGALSGYRIVHFATHGVLDAQHPARSGLVLSQVDERGADQDGYLRLRDIYGLHLDADLVVLSACQTALGREIKGEGLVGLARAFMSAGAPRVVASLWEVSDVATADLMQQFYEGLLEQNLTPAAALRHAQMAIARNPRWRSPYYWAGFVIQGDWK